MSDVHATEQERPQHRLDNIAVSLSGGGVRAVGFHLGLLEMLDRLDLLSKVSILSTVSGGSLTGTGYALSQHYGHSFDQYFREFYEFLPELNTLEKLMQGMSSSAFPSPSGRRDMITVMANIYDDVYFKRYFSQYSEGATPRFGLFWDAPHPDAHLREIIFNATEFETGTAFRFQKSDFRCLIGNANIYLCERHARLIRMADIMAASSCIPVGMEPMFFPDDFHWPDDEGPGIKRGICDEIKTSLRANLHRKFRLHAHSKVDFFALMDGGVYDNQGIVSLLLAMNRLVTKVEPHAAGGECVCGRSLHEGGEAPGPDQWARWLAGKTDQGSEDEGQELEDVGWKEVDLLIISDTPVRKDSLYPKLEDALNPDDPEDAVDLMPAQHRTERRGLASRLSIGTVDIALRVLAVLLLISAGFTIHEEFFDGGGNKDWQDFGSWVDELFQVGIPLLVTVVLAVGLFRFRLFTRRMAKAVYGLLPRDRWGATNPWSYLRKVKIRDVADMLTLRAGSLSALTASIFMNRIRSLSYSAAYSREDLDKHVMTNQIFALEQPVDGKPGDWPKDWPEEVEPISAAASDIVILAAHMKTKLWINRLDKGVANYRNTLKGDDPLTEATRNVLVLNERRAGNGQDPLNDLDVLVICGQMTTCYKLMQFLWRHHRDGNGEWRSADSEDVFQRCLGLWNRLQEDPAGLLDERKSGWPGGVLASAAS